ncbi:MAG TPA: Sec-independent protein translocase protein TatB [Thermoanaerobaculia bacterium]|nr:Sec-independent protein translocase protein TatB [Thermoanaerobaculia bacterium]
MFNMGVPEILIILAVALIVFGPRKLPEIGKTLGKALGEFRKATDDLKNTIEREVRIEELKQIGPSIMPFETVSRSEPLPPLEPTPGPFAMPAEEKKPNPNPNAPPPTTES